MACLPAGGPGVIPCRYSLEPGTDGRLHLPATFSPEYGGNTRDCNYDLMLLTWGCRTLLESAELLGIDDELAPRWRRYWPSGWRIRPTPTAS